MSGGEKKNAGKRTDVIRGGGGRSKSAEISLVLCVNFWHPHSPRGGSDQSVGVKVLYDMMKLRTIIISPAFVYKDDLQNRIFKGNEF